MRRGPIAIGALAAAFVAAAGTQASVVEVEVEVAAAEAVFGRSAGTIERRRVTRSIGPVASASDAPWIAGAMVAGDAAGAAIRLVFGPGTALADGARVHVLVPATGRTHVFDADRLAAWGGRTPWFNGGAALVMLELDPGSSGTVRLDAVDRRVSGPPPAAASGPCFEEDRVPWTDPRIGRLVPGVGVHEPWCTMWIAGDPEHTLLGAGHCAGLAGADAIVEFNVPPSLADGTFVHAAPEDQYPFDLASIQQSTAFGNDWLYAAAAPNPDTGLLPFEAQGAFVPLAAPGSAAESFDVEVLGYGGHPALDERHGALKRDSGPSLGPSGGEIGYAVRTSGGDSGAPVIRLDTGEAVGIHTNNVCADSGASYATRLDVPPLIAALADPQGLCRPFPALTFTYPEGRPDRIDPAGGTQFLVAVGGIRTPIERFPVPGTLELVLTVNGIDRRVPVEPIGPGRARVTTPPLPCGAEVTWHLSAATRTGPGFITGRRGFDPFDVPGGGLAYRATAIAAGGVRLAASFDPPAAGAGWSVMNGPGLTDGRWEAVIPSGGGERGDPERDAEPGSAGGCFVTGDGPGNTDVDGGWTRLVSPSFDASDPATVLCYDRWLSNRAGDAPGEDPLVVDVSHDDGLTWITVETVDPAGPEAAGGWFSGCWRLIDVPGWVPSPHGRVRFTVGDAGRPSVVEAGVDRVRVLVPHCLGS